MVFCKIQFSRFKVFNKVLIFDLPHSTLPVTCGGVKGEAWKLFTAYLNPVIGDFLVCACARYRQA